ncbi:MAG: hypothetical protein U5Q03_06035 [Bacteroidota bacterium]|nr:hypothetical protein [Bacteroidota bacterium]
MTDNNGLSWDNAFRNIEMALAHSGGKHGTAVKVHLADGIYELNDEIIPQCISFKGQGSEHTTLNTDLIHLYRPMQCSLEDFYTNAGIYAHDGSMTMDQIMVHNASKGTGTRQLFSFYKLFRFPLLRYSPAGKTIFPKDHELKLSK